AARKIPSRFSLRLSSLRSSTLVFRVLSISASARDRNCLSLFSGSRSCRLSSCPSFRFNDRAASEHLKEHYAAGQAITLGRNVIRLSSNHLSLAFQYGQEAVKTVLVAALRQTVSRFRGVNQIL